MDEDENIYGTPGEDDDYSSPDDLDEDLWAASPEDNDAPNPGDDEDDPNAPPEDADDEDAAQDYITEDEEGDDPRTAKRISNRSQSYVGWNMEHNSPIINQFNTFDSGSIDPYKSASRYLSEEIDRVYNTRSRLEEKQRAISVFSESIADKYGTSVHLSGTGIYNRSIGKTASTIGSNQTADEIALYKPPQGFTLRATARDWNTFQEQNRSYSMREAVYQLSDSSYVGGLMSRAGTGVKTEVLTQGFEPVTVMKRGRVNKKESLQATRTAAKVLIGNEVSLSALSTAGIETARVTFDNQGDRVNPQFHPKLSYYYEGSQILAGSIGSQNRTASLQNQDSLEETVFLSMKMVENKSVMAQARMEIALNEIAAATDAMFSLAGQGLDYQSSRDLVEQSFRTALGSRIGKTTSEFIKLNKDIHTTRLEILKETAAGGSKSKVVLSIQYLETGLFSSRARGSTGPPTDQAFDKYRKEFFETVETLSRQGRLTLMLSADSISGGEGLNALYDRLNDKGQVFDLFGDDQSSSTKARIRSLLKRSASIAATRLKHSKGMAILNEEMTGFEFLESSSANFGYNSFTKNIEAGAFFDKDAIEELGLADEDVLRYYKEGVISKMSNKGLYVERKGQASQVAKAEKMLEAMGGVKSRTFAGASSAPFRFATRYDAEGNATGLDISMKNAFHFSVTIGSTQESRYDVTLGKQVTREVPVLYLNKGERVIVGMNWMNKSDRNIVVQSQVFDSHARGSSPKVLRPGELLELDALQVLGGMIYTMNQGAAYEENTRVMYGALKKLLEQGDHATLVAMTRAGMSKRKVMETTDLYKELVLSKNVSAIAERSAEIGKVISGNDVAARYHKIEMQRSKAAIYKQITEIYPQPHGLAYDKNQLLWKRPNLGVTEEVATIHYGDSATVIAPGFLLSDLPFDHTEAMYDSQGFPFIRGVSDSKRPSTLNADEMVGGLIKAEGGAATPYSLQLMTSMSGLALISYNDYVNRLTALGIDPASGLGKRLLETVFALEKRRLEEEEGGWEENKHRAVLIYTPFEKTEQNVQRLKNQKSIRNFLPANEDFANFLRSLGTVDYGGAIRKKIDVANAEGSDLTGGTMLGGIIPFAMPSAQFSEFQQWRRQNPNADYEEFARDRALDTSSPTQGFLNSPTWVMAFAGINELSDFSLLNTTYANREKRYIKTYRTQSAISTREMNMTGVEFGAKLREKIKVGTIFVARDVELDRSDSNVYEARRYIESKVDDVLMAQGNITYNSADPNQLRLAVQEMRKRYAAGDKGYAFVEAVDIKEGSIKLKKGVYNMESPQEGLLKRVGGINEGDNFFYIDGLDKYTTQGTKFRIQPFPVKSAAFSSRERNAIDMVFRSPTVSVQDERSSMVTINLEMVDLADLKTGQRTSQAKGPFKGIEEEYFGAQKDIYLRETGPTTLPTHITGEDIFAVINMGQMKGFVFEAGLGFLRMGEQSPTWQMITDSNRDRAGYRVAESLAMMMLGESRDGLKGPTVAQRLKEAYARGDIENRRQAQALLDMYTSGKAKPKKLPRKDSKDDKTKHDFGPTIALYEGLMSLADPNEVGDSDIEYAIVNTVLKALEGGKEGEAAREKLAGRAERLLRVTAQEYGERLDSGEITFDETKARSAAVLAFFLNVSKDVFSDIDTEYRMGAAGLSELAFKTEGFMERARGQDNAEITQRIYDFFEERKNSYPPGASAQIYFNVSSWDKERDELLGFIRNAQNRNVFDLLEFANNQRSANLIRDWSAVGFLMELVEEFGGFSAREWYLMPDELRDSDTADTFRQAFKRQAFALGIKLPDYDRIRELMEKTNKSKSEVKLLNRMDEELDLAIYMMRSLGQFAQGVSLPFDMTINKITVPVGMEDTTALEGHYANALTQRQLDLYTYSASEREKATSLQQTMVILGSMLQEGMGTSLNQSDVSKLYSVRRMSAALLGIDDYAQEDETALYLTPAQRTAAARRNQSAARALRAREASLFTTAFSQAYGFFTARPRDNIFPTKSKKNTKDIAPAEELFYQFIAGDSDGYNTALERMTWNRVVSSDKTNLSMQERAKAITQDYLRRIKNNETIVGGQVDSLLRGIQEAAVTQVTQLAEIHHALTSDVTNTAVNPRVETWARSLEPNARDRAVELLQKANIQIDRSATPQQIAETIALNKDNFRNLSVQEQLEFSSLGFSALRLTLAKTADFTSTDILDGMSMNDKRQAFIQLLVKEKVKREIESSNAANLQQNIQAARLRILNAQTIPAAVSEFIETAPAVQETLLQSIIRNEVMTKLQRAKTIDPGKDYIEGRQQMRRYAQNFLSTGQGSSQEVERARALLENIEKTHSITVPILTKTKDMDASGRYTLEFSPEKAAEGWVLGLDVLERLSLVFPGHTHEALRSQYSLVDALSRAQESGLLRVLGESAQRSGEVKLSTEQLSIYNDLVASAETAQHHIIELSKNKETFRKTMADRLSMTGASFIGTNTFLLRQHEVAIGSRADTLVKDQTGSGLKGLMREIASQIDFLYKEEVSQRSASLGRRGAGQAARIAELDSDIQSGRLSPSEMQQSARALAKLRTQYSETVTAQAQLRELRLPYDDLDRTARGRNLKRYAQLAATVVKDIGAVTGSDLTNITWRSLLDMATKDDTSFDAQQRSAQNTALYQAAVQRAQASGGQMPTLPVEDRIYTQTEGLANALLETVGGNRNDPESVKRLEKVLYRSSVLVNRQGAPSGNFHAFDSAHQQETIEEVGRRAANLGSLLIPDAKAGNTALLISAMGNQFVELGDYDGDSFQAAFTKISEASRQVSEASASLLKARKAYYGMEENEEQLNNPIVSRSVIGEQERAMQALQAAVDDFQTKLRNLTEMNNNLAERSAARIRDFAVDFMGIPRSFLQEGDYTVGAIADDHISSLFKQYRDTATNLYGNRDKVQGQLTEALARLEGITYGRGRRIYTTFDNKGNLSNEEKQNQKRLVERVVKDYREYATGVEFQQFRGMSLDEQKRKLIEYSAMMSQKVALVAGIGKATDKIAGSLLNSAAFTNIQAIVGSTGTGLLGKTYNTVVPLLGLAVSEMSALRAMEESSKGTDRLGSVMTKALQTQVNALLAQRSAATDPEEQKRIDRQLGLTSRLLDRQVNQRMVPYEIEMEQAKSRLNATFGVMLNIQQFLRDAALKPKKGTSVALAAADFVYDVRYADGSTKKIKGLDNILAAVPEQDRSRVMSLFIGTRAANVLAADYEFTYNNQGRVAVQQNLDKSEVRAFALLEMMNEYLSGKYTATQMLDRSAFAGFLKRRKEMVVEQTGGAVPVSDDYIVKSTIADSLAKFRSDYIYNGMLEADDYGPMLDDFTKRLEEGYSKKAIDQRESAYRTRLREVYDRQMQGLTLDPARAQEIGADIDRRTQEWRIREENYATVMEEAKIRAATKRQSGEQVSDGQEVFKAIIEQEMFRQSRDFVGDERTPGIFDNLISLNKVISGLQQDKFATPGTAEQYQIAQTAILYNIARGKLEGTTLNESIYRLAEEVNKGGSKASAEAVGAMLAVGGSAALPGMLDFIQQEAQARSGGDADTRDRLFRESLEALGQILTTKVSDSGEEISVAQLVAEKNVVSASSAKLQEEIAAISNKEAEVRLQQSETLDGSLDADLNILTNMREGLERRLEQVTADPRAAVQAIDEEFDVIGKAVQEVQGKVDENLRLQMESHLQQQKANLYSETAQDVTESRRGSSFLSLLAVPLFFGAVNGDTPITDRVAEIARNVIESALTLSTYEGSITRRFLLGEGSGRQVAREVISTAATSRATAPTTNVLSTAPRSSSAIVLYDPNVAAAAPAPPASPPSSRLQLSDEEDYLSAEERQAERVTGRANYLLRIARAREFIFQSPNRTEGLVQAMAFEALNLAGSAAASNFARNTQILRDDSLGARGAVEILGGVVSMALANVVTKRPIAGTDYNYDFAFDATVQALANIRNSILAASQQALAEAINGNDVDITDGYTGESLDAVFAEGDFVSPDDNTSVTAVERMMMTESTLEGEEGMEMEEG